MNLGRSRGHATGQLPHLRRLAAWAAGVMLTACLLRAGAAAAADPAPAGSAPAETARAADVEAIRAAAAAYQEALARGDGSLLASLWAPEGDIVDDAGNVLLGRDTTALVGGEAAGPKPEFHITETKLRFLCADAAIEDGIVEVRLPGGGTIDGHFAAVWVKHDGAWKLSAIREARTPDAEGSGDLQELDWMVGDWEAVAATTSAATTPGAPAAAQPIAGQQGDPITLAVTWNPTRTFLVRQMRIPPPPGAPDDAPSLEISQQIGWDPLARQVRGWAFGTDGSHGESTWIREGDAWIARTVSVRPDGRKMSTLTVYTPDGPDRCTLQALPTHIGSEHEPHVVLQFQRTGRPPHEPTPTRPGERP
jgi:uncharacterized protein (TIGR02246 family)